MGDGVRGAGVEEGAEASLDEAYQDLFRRLGGVGGHMDDAVEGDYRGRLARLLSDINGPNGLCAHSLDSLCRRARLSIPWYDPPETAVSAQAAPTFALRGDPAAGTTGFHEVELDPAAPILMLSSDWPTGVPQMPWAVRVLPIAYHDAGDGLVGISHGLYDTGATICPNGPQWGLLDRNGDVLWSGKTRDGLEFFWETHAIRLEGGWLPVLDLGLAYNYDQGILVCLDPGSGTYDIADVFDVELPDSPVPTNRAVALSLTADGPSALAELAACGDTGQTDYGHMVERLASEPGWMPADPEHLLGEYLRRNGHFAQAALDASAAWRGEAGSAVR